MKRYLSYRQPHEYCQPAKRYSYKGEWLTALELSERTGIPRPTICARIRRGQQFDIPGKSGPEPKRYLFRGERMTVPQIAKLTGLDKSTVYDRISGDRVLDGDELHNPDFPRSLPSHARLIIYKGKTLCISQWARELGISEHAMRSRLVWGWSMDRIASEPVMSASVRGTRLRNRRAIRRMSTSFRRDRNAQLIHRISIAFRTAEASLWR